MKSYIKNINQRELEDLLGYKANQIFKVPDYQRPFSWNKSTAEVFISDLYDKFNIKDFHSAVLDHGNPPLFIVEEMVNNMIRENLN